MTFEEFVAQQGYAAGPGGSGIYYPNDLSEAARDAKQNLSQGMLEELYRQVVNPSGQSAWGTSGAPVATPITDDAPGSSNDVVQINGTMYTRLGGDYSNQAFAQYGIQPQYDPTYGWIIPTQVADSLAKMMNPDGFLEKIAGNLPVILGGVVLGNGLYSAYSGAGAGAGAGASGAAASSTGGAGGIGTAGSAFSASELASLGFSAADMAALGVPASEIAASTAGMSGSGVLGDIGGITYGDGPGIGGSFQNVSIGGDAAGYDLPYNYDPYTGDTVGLGSTPLSELYFSTNPSLAALGGGGGATAGGSALSSLGDLLKTPGITQALSGGLRAIGGLLGSKAQAGAVGDANNTLWNMYQQNRADMTPYRMAGYNALGNMVNMTTPGYKWDNTDPGAAYRLDSANRALEMRQRAGGKFYSGPGLQGVAELNQGLASQEFGNAFNRNASLAGIGQTANNTTAQLGANTAGQVANNQVDIGNARASGYASGLGGVANALDIYSNAQQFDKLLDAVLKRSV